MGQDYGQIDEWNENASLEWDLLKYPLHKNMQTYVRELNKLYQAHPALYEQDFETEGFEWINCSYHEESMIMFVRRGKEETLLCVCNFDNVDHDKFRLGVPFAGKYKEIFNSDSKEFGGEGRTNSRAKSSRKMMQLKPVLEYIDSNYGQTITLNELSRIAGMSPKYFCSYFHSIIHRTPIDYLNYYRIERACSELSTSDLTLTEVAYRCGFSDVCYFIKTFKRYKGITPHRYCMNIG